MKIISEEQVQEKWKKEIEAIAERPDLSEDEMDSLISEKFEGYKRESFEAFVRRYATALHRHKQSRDDEGEQRFVDDYTKVAMAKYNAPPEKEHEEFERALREVWERRRREKAARLAKEDKGKN
ncbi:MAG TPA: hypothetical protein VI685_06740 [Candidatus Angelobacter sp.]